MYGRKLGGNDLKSVAWSGTYSLWVTREEYAVYVVVHASKKKRNKEITPTQTYSETQQAWL